MMKTANVLMTLFFSSAILFTACSIGLDNGPKIATERFFAAMKAGDIDQAKEYGTSSTGSLLDLMNSFGGAEVMDGLQEMPAFTVQNCVVDGDKATCEIIDEEAASADEEATETTDIPQISLKKVDGEWKVDMSKESMMNKEEFQNKEDFNEETSTDFEVQE